MECRLRGPQRACGLGAPLLPPAAPAPSPSPPLTVPHAPPTPLPLPLPAPPQCQAIDEAPAGASKPLFLAYAKYEEEHGLARNAMQARAGGRAGARAGAHGGELLLCLL